MHGFLRLIPPAQLWEKCQGTDGGRYPVDGPLRCATMDVLHDNANPGVLTSGYQAICKRAAVAGCSCYRLKRSHANVSAAPVEEHWVRKDYVLSVILDHSECTSLAATRGHNSMGNILSKIHLRS